MNNNYTRCKVSLLTWNVLASCYIFPESYKYVKKNMLLWSRRRTLIRQILRAQHSDIVCLQEVDHPKDVKKDESESVDS